MRSARRSRELVATLLFLTLSACMGGAPPAPMTLPLPDWSGPAVHCRHFGDRSLLVELLAPTAGHRLTLLDVIVDGARADVHLRHEPPTADFVAQVVTPLGVEVPAEQLGQASAVCVWLRSGDAAERLALTTARP